MTDDLLSIARSPVSLSDQVVNAVRDAIASGALAPGQRLIEREMMERTGVGRTSIREAMNQLRSMGLVQERDGGGLQVAVLDADTVRHIYELRRAIEPAVSRLFTERATDEEVEELVALGSEPAAATINADLQSAIPGRHEQLLFAGARSPLLWETIAPYYVRIQEVRRLSLAIPGRLEATVAEQRRIFDAISRRDPIEAALAARDHVDAAQASAIEALQKISGAG